MIKNNFVLFSAILWIVFVTILTLKHSGKVLGNGYEDVGLLAGFCVVGIFSAEFLLHQLAKTESHFIKNIARISYFIGIPFGYKFAIDGLPSLSILPLGNVPRFITAFLVVPLFVSIWGLLAMVGVVYGGFWIGNTLTSLVNKKKITADESSSSPPETRKKIVN